MNLGSVSWSQSKSNSLCSGSARRPKDLKKHCTHTRHARWWWRVFLTTKVSPISIPATKNYCHIKGLHWDSWKTAWSNQEEETCNLEWQFLLVAAQQCARSHGNAHLCHDGGNIDEDHESSTLFTWSGTGRLLILSLPEKSDQRMHLCICSRAARPSHGSHQCDAKVCFPQVHSWDFAQPMEKVHCFPLGILWGWWCATSRWQWTSGIIFWQQWILNQVTECSVFCRAHMNCGCNNMHHSIDSRQLAELETHSLIISDIFVDIGNHVFWLKTFSSCQ